MQAIQIYKHLFSSSRLFYKVLTHQLLNRERGNHIIRPGVFKALAHVIAK